MNPKDKASMLMEKMLSKNPNRQDGISSIDISHAKLCALVAVEELIDDTFEFDRLRYWNEVKKELNEAMF